MKSKIQIFSLLLLLAAMPAVVRAQTTESYTFTTNRVVPDGDAAGLNDLRTINSAIGTITSLNVRLKMDNEYNGDAYAYLRHSSGYVVLLNRVGRSAANPYGYPDSGFNITFTSSATNGDIHVYENSLTPPDGAPLMGFWQPDGRNADPYIATDTSLRTTSLTNFNGLNAAGTWTLFLADVDAGATNVLTEWGLDITGVASPTIVWANPADITYGTALGTTQLNATATYNSTNVPGTFTYTPAAGTVLNAGFGQTLSVSFTPADTTSFAAVSTNVAINVTPASLSITANSRSKTYGQTVTFAGTEFTTTGLVNSDTVTSVTLTSSGAAATATVAGSTYSIVPTAAVGTGLANYSITYNNGALTVNPAGLSITANSTSKTYGQTVTFAGTEFTTAGLVNSDSVTSVTLTSSGAAATATVAGSPYNIVPSAAVGTGLANYSISYNNGLLTVNRATLAGTVDSKSRLYGAVNPAFTVSYLGFVNSESVSVLIGTPTFTCVDTNNANVTTNTPVGVYPIHLVTGQSGANYTINYTDGSLTINQAVLLATADDKSRAYGQTNPVFTATYTGFVNGEDTNVLSGSGSPAFSTAADTNSVVGTYPIDIALGTLSNANYSFTFSNGTLHVTAYALTINVDSTNRFYGQANPVFTGTIVGLQNGDNITATYVTTADTHNPVSTYAITPVLTDAGHMLGNYNVTTNAGVLTVNPAALTITANSTSKTYGDTVTFAGTEFGTTGLVNSDTVTSVTLTSSGAAATATVVGSPYDIVPSAAVGTGLSNYAISYVNGALTVNPAALSVTANSTSKLYGQTVTFAGTEFTTAGLLNSDSVTSVTLTSSGTAAIATVAGSAFNIIPSAAVGSSLGNYSVNYVNGFLAVNPAPLTITADSKSKAYGAALPPLTASYSGFVLSQTMGDLTTPPTLVTAATANSDVGTYSISASGAVDSNYAFTYVAGTLTVTQPLTIGSVTSSANPALPGTNVTFSLSVSPIAPGAGTPVGTVNFRIDGSIAGSGSLSDGVATYATSTLSHGTHTVVAEYAGNLNYIGTTNSLAPNQVINTPPVAGNVAVQRPPTQGVKFHSSILVTNTSDADGDTLTLTISTNSLNGGTITTSGNFVFYTPAAGYTNVDSFTYTVTDGHGGSATGTVTVGIFVDNLPSENLTITVLGNGNVLINGNGISGRTYHMQFTHSLSPANWQDIPGGTVTANNVGMFEFTDTTGEGSGYYRSASPAP